MATYKILFVVAVMVVVVVHLHKLCLHVNISLLYFAGLKGASHKLRLGYDPIQTYLRGVILY